MRTRTSGQKSGIGFGTRDRHSRRPGEPTFSAVDLLHRHLWTRNLEALRPKLPFTLEVPYAVTQPCRAAACGRDGSVQCEPHHHFTTAWFCPGGIQPSRNPSVRHDEHRDTGSKRIRVGQLTRAGGRCGSPTCVQVDASPSPGTTFWSCSRASPLRRRAAKRSLSCRSSGRRGLKSSVCCRRTRSRYASTAAGM